MTAMKERWEPEINIADHSIVGEEANRSSGYAYLIWAAFDDYDWKLMLFVSEPLCSNSDSEHQKQPDGTRKEVEVRSFGEI